jgi:hypothetical protein
MNEAGLAKEEGGVVSLNPKSGLVRYQDRWEAPSRFD